MRVLCGVVYLLWLCMVKHFVLLPKMCLGCGTIGGSLIDAVMAVFGRPCVLNPYRPGPPASFRITTVRNAMSRTPGTEREWNNHQHTHTLTPCSPPWQILSFDIHLSIAQRAVHHSFIHLQFSSVGRSVTLRRAVDVTKACCGDHSST